MHLSAIARFFNVLIFFYHKVQNILRSNEDLTFCEALSVLRKSPLDVPEIFLSGVERVTIQDYKCTQEMRRVGTGDINTRSQDLPGSCSVNNANTPYKPSPSLDLSKVMSSSVVLNNGSKDQASFDDGIPIFYNGARPRQNEDEFSHGSEDQASFDHGVHGSNSVIMPIQKEDDDISEDEEEEVQAVQDTSLLVEVCLDESLDTIAKEMYSISTFSQGLDGISKDEDEEVQSV